MTNHQDDEELLFKPEDIARIEHIGSRFAPYLKKIQPLYDEYIARQIPSIAHITSLLENYYYFLSFIGDEGILNDSHKSIMGIAAKTASDVGGIYRLIQTGFPVQARAVLRTLLETAITTKFIYQDYQNRLPLYADFSDFQRYLKSRSTPEAIPQSEHEYLRKRFEELKPRYQVGRDWYFRLLKELKKSHPELPERPSIKGMALLVGMSEDYDAYQTLSLVTHPSAVIDHVFMWEDGRFSMGPKFDRDMALTSVALTVNFAHIVFEQILTHIGTEKAVAMIQYSKMLNYQAQRTCLELLSRPLPIKKTNVDEANSGIHY